MKNGRFTLVAVLLAIVASYGLAQQATRHLLSKDEVSKVIPTDYFYRGQKAPVQLRNAAGFQLANGRMTLAALVDASGYASSIQEKYQGMLITESKLDIGGSEVVPGQYGFGFTAGGKFVVMDVANNDLLSVSYSHDTVMKRPVPLQFVEDGDGFKLYGGRKWVSVKPE